MQYNNIIYFVLAIAIIIIMWQINKNKNKETMGNIENIENTSMSSPQINTGFFDSDNYLIIGPKETIPDGKSFISPSCPSNTGVVNQLSNVCRRPTIDNPFMNPAVTEFNNIILPVACNAFDEDIKEEIKVNFNHELFRDVEGEVFERANSRRQFYTLPNVAVPNNQTEFANWLYRLPTSANCKEDTSACLRYSPKYDHIAYPL